MAERIVRQLIDDIDGSEISDGEGERLEFSIRGVDYKIDLNSANVAKFEKAVRPYIAAAENGGALTSPSSQSPTKATQETLSKEQAAAIRDWARQNGYTVSPRGRIKAEVMNAFNAAH